MKKVFLFLLVGTLQLAMVYAGASCSSIDLKQNFRKARRVVIAKAVHRGQSPGIWSGAVPAEQEVTFLVVQNLKGPDSPKRIKVKVPLVEGSNLVDKSQPKVASRLFNSSREVIVFLKKDSGDYTLFDQDCGVVQADKRNIKVMQEVTE